MTLTFIYSSPVPRRIIPHVSIASQKCPCIPLNINLYRTL